MKKFIVLLIVSVSVFSQELIIEKNKEFQVEILPNMYTSNFSLRIESSYEKPIEVNFQKAIKIVSKSDICKGGKYNIYPNTTKKNYQGYINFDCKFQAKKDYEELLEKIKKLDGKVSQGRISLSNTKQSIQDTQNKLEKMALEFPFDYSLYLEKNLSGFDCEASKISFNSSNYTPTPFLLRSAKANSETVVTPPIEEEIVHSLRVNYVFTCKTKDN
jgi:hypothetical protein